MLKKFGINTVSSKKSGPTVKKAIALPASHKFRKVIHCECGAKLSKCCDDEKMCERSFACCPKCGREVK